jgi:cell division protein FtsQ
LAITAAAAGLRVHDVQILGRANTPEPLLRAAIGIAPDDPILGVSVADIRSRVETLNWVEHVTVERRLPSTIVIQLIERRPFAIWQHQSKFSLIDRQGQVVDDQNLASYGQLPLLVGPGAPVAAAPLLDLMRDRPAIADRVVAAVRVGERRWNLRLLSGADVLLPEGADQAALDRLIELQQTEALLDRPVQIIDLRLADRLVVRPLADSHGSPATNSAMPIPPAPATNPPATNPPPAPGGSPTHRSI